jgi:tetratricopeptide (TPR) repeat protein
MDDTKVTSARIDEQVAAKKKSQGSFHAELAEMYKSRADRSRIFTSDYDLAIDEYKKSIRIDPDEPEYYARLAIILCKKNLLIEAIDNLKKAIALNKNERRYQVYFAMALTKWGVKSDSAEFHVMLGNVCKDLDLLELAQKEYAKSIQLAPREPGNRDKYFAVSREIGKRTGKPKSGENHCEECGRELLPWEFSVCDICFSNNDEL